MKNVGKCGRSLIFAHNPGQIHQQGLATKRFGIFKYVPNSTRMGSVKLILLRNSTKPRKVSFGGGM
jgi:hypothetical protein